jgi:hypothetical protein
VLDAFQLPGYFHLVEVLIFAYPDETHLDGDLVTLLEKGVLVKSLIWEVGVKFVDTIRANFTNFPFLHGFDNFSNQTGKGEAI